MSNDVVARMQRLQEDHGPESWPAVQMRDITTILDEIERLTLVVRKLNGQVDHLGIRLGEVIRERDALRDANVRADCAMNEAMNSGDGSYRP